MNIFKRAQAALRYMVAVRKAEEAHAETGDRYYVLPAGDKSEKLLIMNRKNFRRFKLKGYIAPTANVSNLERECFYCTSYKNGKDLLPDAVVKMKRNEYLQFLLSLEKRRAEERRAEKKRKESN